MLVHLEILKQILRTAQRVKLLSRRVCQEVFMQLMLVESNIVHLPVSGSLNVRCWEEVRSLMSKKSRLWVSTVSRAQTAQFTPLQLVVNLCCKLALKERVTTNEMRCELEQKQGGGSQVDSLGVS